MTGTKLEDSVCKLPINKLKRVRIKDERLSEPQDELDDENSGKPLANKALHLLIFFLVDLKSSIYLYTPNN